MAYASRSGRARVSSSSPQAFGVCDRCGQWYNRVDLRNQFEWRGASLKPLYIFVCNSCYDTPQEQLRAIVIPADPVPIVQPRTEPFLVDETTYLTPGNATTDPTTGIPVPSQVQMQTASGGNMTAEPLGLPKGLVSPAIMPETLFDGNLAEFGETIPFIAAYGLGSNQVTVTCSQDVTRPPWNLATGSQVAVEGLSNTNADGFFSITLVTPTMFTYTVYGTVAGGLQTPGTVMRTCLVGVPLGWDTIPVTPPGAWQLAPKTVTVGTPIGLLLTLTHAV